MPGTARTMTPASRRRSTASSASPDGRNVTSVACCGGRDHVEALSKQRAAAIRHRPRVVKTGRGREAERRGEAGERRRRDHPVEPPGALRRSEGAVRLRASVARSTSGGAPRCARDRRRTTRRSHRGRRATSDPRRCSSPPSPRPGSRQPTAHRRRAAARRSARFSSATGSRWPVIHDTCGDGDEACARSDLREQQLERTLCRLAARVRHANGRPGRLQRPQQPEVLLVRRHDLVPWGDAQAREDDLAAMRRRGRQRQMVVAHAEQCGDLRADAGAKLLQRVEVRAAASPVLELEVNFRPHRVHRRLRERAESPRR